MNDVLSLFGGVGMLDSAFTDAGFDVVNGPDLLRGEDVREYSPASHFAGVIGGTPCQDFSDARRSPESGVGVQLLREFLRVTFEARADWFLIENVRRVPAVSLAGYSVQRLMLQNTDFGGIQRRLRCFQFGSLDGSQIAPLRVGDSAPGGSHARTLTGKSPVTELEAWRLQGHGPRPLALGRTRAMQAIANGVPYPLATAVARAVTRQVSAIESAALCACGCGRWLPPGRSLFAPECRQRVSRAARFGVRGVTWPETGS